MISEYFIKQALFHLMPLLQEKVQKHEQTCEKLVLGINDFAIRKGNISKAFTLYVIVKF